MLFVALLPFSTSAQDQNKKRKHVKNIEVAPENKKPMETFKNPAWAPAGYKSQYHVYFPDYDAFYDPNRGYIIKEKDTWTATPSMPLFLSNEELPRTRIQILEDLSLDMRPEQNYPRYMKMYPRDPKGKVILTPVPNSAGRPGQ